MRRPIATKIWTYGSVPVLAVALFVALIQVVGPFLRSDPSVPPAESLSIERIDVEERGFAVKIRADSPEPVVIAQIQVDGAFWTFSQAPPGPVRRMQTAWLQVPFPWGIGETHHLRLITSTGITFDDSVEIAITSPTPTWELLADYTLLGICVGLAPVALGMLFFPLLRSLRRTGLEFVLAFTIGLLAYLLVDLTTKGLALAQEASQLFQGSMLIWIPMALTFGALAALANRSKGNASGVRVAMLVALGFGLHNFGEGLAIGASLAVNQIALGAFLIIGFTLHNVTEGVGVVSPLTREHVPGLTLVALAALAGLPAVPGIWLGAFSFAPHWAAILFGIGAGAIVQVVIEIDRFLSSRVRSQGTGRFSPASAAGYTTGAAVMYATALLVAA